MNLMQQDIRKKILLGQDGNSLVLLVVVNVIIYILLSFLKIIYLVNDSTQEVFKAQVFSWISVPAQPMVFATRPWTLLSYMFAHFTFWDLFSGMVWLWIFGYILQTLTGNRKLIPVYLYGGLAGSISFLLIANLIPSLRININSVLPLMGGGPAIMAVAVAVTTLEPRYRIFPMLNFPLWMLTVLFITLRVGTAIVPYNYVSPVALLMGGFAGFLFARQLQRGNDLGQWMSDGVNWLNDLFNPVKKRPGYAPKEELFYKAGKKPFEKTPHVTQQRVDDLLDKINSRGYNSLTDDEKEFLKKASSEEL